MQMKIVSLGIAVLVLPVMVAMGQISIEPPPESATKVTPTATAPGEAKGGATQGASTLPTAENVLESLLHNRPAVSPVAPKGTTPAATGSVVPAMVPVAAAEPKGKLMRERETVEKRVGRLVKDEKSTNWVFVFDADGNEMHDSPLTILPSLMLEAMEGLSENGAKAVKFRVSGEVTQYRGRNFLLIRYAQVVKDLNQGLGG